MRRAGALTMLGFDQAPVVTFEERAPHERGFAQTFREHVAPQLAQLETDRRLTIVRMTGVFGLCVVGTGVMVVADFALAAKIALGCAFCLPWIPAAMFWTREERQIMGAVVRHFPGLTCDVSTQIPEERLQPYRRLALLPPPESPALLSIGKLRELVKLEEEMAASHRGIGIWLGEGEILETQGGDESRLFYGTLIEFTLPARPDADYTMDAGSAGRTANSPARISLATETVRIGLETLGERLGSQAMKCDVSGRVVYVVLPHDLRARPFSVGGIAQSAYLCEPMIRASLAQLAQLYAVADALADACALAAPPS